MGGFQLYFTGEIEAVGNEWDMSDDEGPGSGKADSQEFGPPN